MQQRRELSSADKRAAICIDQNRDWMCFDREIFVCSPCTFNWHVRLSPDLGFVHSSITVLLPCANKPRWTTLMHGIPLAIYANHFPMLVCCLFNHAQCALISHSEVSSMLSISMKCSLLSSHFRRRTAVR